MTADPMPVTEALDALRRHATGQLQHRNGGSCPSPVEGPDDRDPQCEVCQALTALRPDGPLREQVAPDQDVMAAAEVAGQGVTPPPGWTAQEWLTRYGRYALIAGVIAAANTVRVSRIPTARDAGDDPARELVDACDHHDGVLAPTDVAHAVMKSTWLARRDEAIRRQGALEAMHEFGFYANGIWSIRPYPGDRAHAWRDALARGEVPWRR